MKKIYFFLVAMLFTLSTGAQTLRGDVNGDGVVNIGDVTDLVNIILYGDEEEPDTPVVPEEPAVATGEAIDLGLPSGTRWSSCNVGATESWEYGGYYAWGETEEKNEYSWSTYKYCNGSAFSMTKYCTDSEYGTVDDKTTLEPEDDVAYIKWGGAWRTPTFDEMRELLNNCTWVKTALNGVSGYSVTGPNGNSIFLPAAGFRDGTEVYRQGSYCTYFSSLLSSGLGYNAVFLYLDDSYYGYYGTSRDCGRSVRPVCSGTANYTVTVSIQGHGSIAINGTNGTTAIMKEGDNVTIIATSSEGEEFSGWYTNDGETLVSTESLYTFVAGASNVTLIAKFIIRPGAESCAVDLGLPSGIKWANCNVGANAPEEFGGYYAWGETEEKDDYSWSTYCKGCAGSFTKYCTYATMGTLDNKTTLEPEDDAAHVKWGGSWRIPTLDEINELKNNCTWTWIALNGVRGYRVTGPNGNSIFLPAAGCRDGAELFHKGNYGYYSSSSLNSSSNNFAHFLHFYSNSYDLNSNGTRSLGKSVRPVCE